MKLGILRETKNPFDKRVCLIPEQVSSLIKHYPQHKFFVQSSHDRAFSDSEYQALGVEIVEDMNHCDILFGVKEVNIEDLISGKIYCFFSHTAKEQAQNQKLLRRYAELGITLIDYEYLKKDALRVIAFGYWAGIVGAYNALIAYGILTDSFNLKPANECIDLQHLLEELKKVRFTESVRIVVTGEGRVASGATEILGSAGVQRVTPDRFLKYDDENVFCQIGPQQYTTRNKDYTFDFQVFLKHPEYFHSAFFPFAAKANVFIACHFWDNRSPVFLTRKQMLDAEFRIKLIADISCDVNGPIPSTIRASTIEFPFYAYDVQSNNEVEAFLKDSITVMAVDNLPGELPRDSSYDFGKKLVDIVLPELLSGKKSEMIENATILKEGKLTKEFEYLKDYLANSLI